MNPIPSDVKIFRFDKSLLTRLQECTDVLQVDDRPVPASRVRREWAYFVELQIEPTGWQAFWRIPRVICESFRIAYPTIVFGTVELVVFKELRAHFIVTGVPDVDVQLPERHEVALVDLLPVRQQENDALNIERTADCLDQLRYFYQHVWRPWDVDSDDDHDWSSRYAESRIRFHQDLIARDNRISAAMAAKIQRLLVEAQDLQQRRQYVELDLDDDEDLNESKRECSTKSALSDPKLILYYWNFPTTHCRPRGDPRIDAPTFPARRHSPRNGAARESSNACSVRERPQSEHKSIVR